MFLQRLVTGSGAFIICATPVVKAAAATTTQKEDVSKLAASNQVCKPSELPIYPTPVATVAKMELDEPSELEKALMEPVKVVRASLVSAVQQVQSTSAQIGSAVSETTDQFSFIITYLREEDNEAQRIGATAMGTLTGLIFGLRGGFFKKLTFALLGTAGMGSICYPEEASHYFNESVTQGKLLANVAYNFVMGVKPGDPEANQEFLPDFKIPSSFSELSDMVSNSWKKSTETKKEEKPSKAE